MKKVLIVDDSPLQCSSVERILSDAGYQVRSITDGSQALETVKSYVPHLILMDVNMPITDGFAATRQLKGDATTKDIPIVFLTSKDQKADKAWGQILGAAGYLTKPCDDTALLNEVNRILS